VTGETSEMSLIAKWSEAWRRELDQVQPVPLRTDPEVHVQLEQFLR
jgi:hypothetical protein